MRKIFRATLPLLLMAVVQACASTEGTEGTVVSSSSSPADAAGAWSGYAGGGIVPVALRLTQAGANVTGNLEVRGRPDLTGPVQGTVQGNLLRLSMVNGMSLTPMTVMSRNHIVGVIPVGPVALERVPARPVRIGAPQPVRAAAQRATFAAVHFAFDKSEIAADEMRNVGKIVDYMKQEAGTFVMLDGHADPRGTEAHNLTLSQRRVEAVRDALVKAGVPADRITTIASGERKPVCAEQTEDCFQLDRRVEVYITTDRASYPAAGVK